MRDFIFSLLCYAVVLVAVAAVFWFFKYQHRVTIEYGDRSMTPAYEPNTYWLKPPPLRARDLEPGRAYAFYVPGDAAKPRVAWLIAREGQRVRFDGKTVLVDGAGTTQNIGVQGITRPEVVVPRGCAFLIATLPASDSLKFGPIPVRNILGQLPTPTQNILDKL